jgi:hypothetical protein
MDDDEQISIAYHRPAFLVATATGEGSDGAGEGPDEHKDTKDTKDPQRLWGGSGKLAGADPF